MPGCKIVQQRRATQVNSDSRSLISIGYRDSGALNYLYHAQRDSGLLEESIPLADRVINLIGDAPMSGSRTQVMSRLSQNQRQPSRHSMLMHRITNKRFTKSFGSLRQSHNFERPAADFSGEHVLNETSMHDADNQFPSKLSHFKSSMPIKKP